MRRDAWMVKFICIFSINSTLTPGKKKNLCFFFIPLHKGCFGASILLSSSYTYPIFAFKKPVHLSLMQWDTSGQVLMLQLWQKEQRDFKTGMFYWNLIQKFLVCTHSSKQKQNHSLLSVLQRWGRAKKLQAGRVGKITISHTLSGAAAKENTVLQGSVPSSLLFPLLSLQLEAPARSQELIPSALKWIIL